MMKKQAQDALDTAFAVHVGKLFSVLISNVVEGEGDAGGKFSKGLAAADEAHAIASGIVEKTFVD